MHGETSGLHWPLARDIGDVLRGPVPWSESVIWVYEHDPGTHKKGKIGRLLKEVELLCQQWDNVTGRLDNSENWPFGTV